MIRRILHVAVPVLAAAALAPAAGARAPIDRCANPLCTRWKPHVPSCYRYLPATRRVASCFIVRAAHHYRQPWRDGIRVAHCESKGDGYYIRWWIDGHHEGMFQFLWSTWRSTPYGRRSPYSPRWASLGAMWMWTHGRRGEWACQ